MYSPNGEQTAQELKELDMMALCLRGTAYRQIVRAGGVIQEINYLHPDRVEVKRDAQGRLSYIYTREDGVMVTLGQDEVWRTMGLSLNGVQGLSPISYMREAIGFSLAAEEQGASIYRNGMQVTTVIKHPATMTENAYKNLKKSMDERIGSRNAGKSFILEEGATIDKLSMSAVDAQFIETRGFQVEEIARAYGVPTYKINHYDGMTFNNVAQLAQDWVTSGVMPWAHKFEQTACRDLLLPNERKKYFLRADPTVLLRGDNANRAAYYASGIQNGWLTRNEARQMEGRNKLDGLDEPLSPLNMGKGSQLQGTNDGKEN
jgi:HK97 family phage portal protein